MSVEHFPSSARGQLNSDDGAPSCDHQATKWYPRYEYRPSLTFFLFVCLVAMPHFEEAVSIEETANHLYERLIALRDRYAKDESHRILVAVAGVPGSGKSTIAAALSKIYFRKQQRRLAVFPMVRFLFPTLQANSQVNLSEGRFPLSTIRTQNIPRSRACLSSSRSRIHFRCQCLHQTCTPAQKDTDHEGR